MSGSIYLRQKEQRTDKGEHLLCWQLLRNVAITGEFAFLAVIAQGWFCLFLLLYKSLLDAVAAADGRTVYPTFCSECSLMRFSQTEHTQ